MIICINLLIITQQCFSIVYFHSCALFNVSNLTAIKCWGRNNYGQLGYGDTQNRGDGANEMGQNLSTINLGDNFIPMMVAMGSYENCAISTPKKVKCWGWNFKGQLGYGDTEDRGDGPNEMGNNLTEVDLGDNFDVVQITMGNAFSCALSADGYVKCWGHYYGGRLGSENSDDIGDEPNEMGNNLTEIDLGSNFTVTKISAGAVHTCAVSNYGRIKCWVGIRMVDRDMVIELVVVMIQVRWEIL